MKKKLSARIIYISALIINFYLLPCLIRDAGGAMLFMLCVMPLLTLMCSLLYGVKYGYSWLLPLFAAVLFIPSIFIFYNLSAWVYAAFHAALAAAGCGIGRLFYQKT